MDGLFVLDSLDVEAEAASGLLTLKQLVDARADPIYDSKASSRQTSRRPSSEDSAGDKKAEEETYPENITPPSSVTTTPVRQFKLAGAKRVRDDLVTLSYTSDGSEIQVPYFKGETLSTLFLRRDEAARRLFDANRCEIYCSWRSTMVSLIVHDSRWIQFRESLQQKRYHHKAVQLVITRYTCTQWRDVKEPCRNCCNRNWRTGCQRPTFIMHVLPLPVYRNRIDLCEEALAELEPLDVLTDKTAWTTRMPQMHFR